MCCQCHAAWSLWMLGYPDQALQHSQEALRLARALSHPVTLAHAQWHIARFHQLRRDRSKTQELAEALQQLATEQGLPSYLTEGAVLRGWALAEGGRVAEGLAQIRQGLAAMGSTSVLFYRISSLALLAGACGKSGQAEEGLIV